MTKYYFINGEIVVDNDAYTPALIPQKKYSYCFVLLVLRKRPFREQKARNKEKTQSGGK